VGGRTGSTRFGFSGGGAESDEPRQPPEGPRKSKTLYGRDLHGTGALTAPPGSVPHPSPASWPGHAAAVPADPPRPAPAASAPADSAYRPAPPSHSGKSKFPARAGFWGRRNSHGEIVPLTDPGLVPAGMLRWRILPHVLVVLASAALSFIAVMLVMKLREPAPAPAVAPVPVVPAAPAVPAVQTLPAPESPAARPRVTRPRRPPGQPSVTRPRRQNPGPDDPIPPRF
jgi:hypothetical protein